MKKLGSLLKKTVIVQNSKPVAIDEKSLFFIFKTVIKEEYGKQGAEQLQPHFWKDKKLFIKAGNSNWANEVWLNKEQIVRKINKEIGWDEVADLGISN